MTSLWDMGSFTLISHHTSTTNGIVCQIFSPDALLMENEVGVDAAPGFVRDIGVPSPEKFTFTFWKPKSFDVFGSYSVRSILKPLTNVDILIQMPKECFHEKIT